MPQISQLEAQPLSCAPSACLSIHTCTRLSLFPSYKTTTLLYWLFLLSNFPTHSSTTGHLLSAPSMSLTPKGKMQKEDLFLGMYAIILCRCTLGKASHLIPYLATGPILLLLRTTADIVPFLSAALIQKTFRKMRGSLDISNSGELRKLQYSLSMDWDLGT